jgi:hypothetical protein
MVSSSSGTQLLIGTRPPFLTSSQEAGVVQAKGDWSMALIHSNADFFQVHVVVSVGLDALNQIAIFFVDLRVSIFCHVNKTQTF